MIKKITVTIVLLIMGYIGATWYTGSMIEENFDTKLSSFNTNINQYFPEGKSIKVTYSNYEKGIFSTSVKMTFVLISSISHENQKYEELITIYHGPLPWVSVKSGDLAPKAAFIKSDTQPEVISSVSISYNGDIHGVLSGKKASDLAIGPYRLDVKTNNELAEININFNIDDFYIPIAEYRGKGIVSSINLTKEGEGYKADSQLDIEQLSFMSPYYSKVTLNQLSFIASGEYSSLVRNSGRNEHYKIDGQIGKLIITSPYNSDLNLALNQISLSTSGESQNNHHDGKAILSIAQQQLGIQDLGNIEANFSYALSPENEFYNFEHFNWLMDKEQMDIKFAVDINKQELTKDFNYTLSSPASFLVNLIAKIEHPQKEVTEEDKEDILSIIESMLPEIIKINQNENNQTILSSDVHYSEKNNQYMINGQYYTLEEFKQAFFILPF